MRIGLRRQIKKLVRSTILSCALALCFNAVVRVDLNGWKDPAVKKYKITSAPQFWFYNRKSKLVRKLVERFTSEDIDSALKAARK